MATAPKAKAKKKDVKIANGVLHVQTTSNNTLINLVDVEGNKIVGGGTGKVGYKGSKKSTPYAAEVLTKQLLKEGQALGLKEIGIIFRGTGMSRDGVFKAINEIGVIDVSYIKEETPVQFGGCKGKRPKRN
ncbi:MAG: 30S ribosomal protein S11 [Candidatus Peribacteria bacterium]|jgi:small subunit ribosomal protein S11|nr:30S ribosomal protein S11 [Candidatus Peribacteria bacterium]